MSGRRAVATLVASVALLAGCGGNGDGSADGGSDADLGREVFTSIAEPTCGSCHTLADAGTDGTVGPNLDDVRPSADRVESAVRAGLGVMPSFEGRLSDEEITAVSGYVADAAG